MSSNFSNKVVGIGENMTMKIRNENIIRLYECLCDTKEEKNEFNYIYNSYDNEYDVITNYRKSRIKRNICQYTSNYIQNIINNTLEERKINKLQETFQDMFGDIIERQHIKIFLDKAEQNTNIIHNLVKLHQKFSLEKFHNLLLVLDDEDVIGYLS